MHFTHKKMNGALAQVFDSFVPAILAHSKQCIRDLMKLNGLPIFKSSLTTSPINARISLSSWLFT